MLQEQTERGRQRVSIKSFDADADMSGAPAELCILKPGRLQDAC
jgi:hypothetical protein